MLLKMRIEDFLYVLDVTKDNNILLQKRMNWFSSDSMAIKCICLGIDAFNNGYGICYGHGKV